MSAKNPHFKQLDRSAFELGMLLRGLPSKLDLTDTDTRLQLEAADRHADNYYTTMLDGLESMGRLMWSACENEQWPVERSDMARIGNMISQIAVQVQFLDEFRESVRDRIDEAEKKGARK